MVRVLSKLFLLCLIAGLSSVTHAEYRVYELEIEDTESGKSRTVTTTLDHFQYGRYYPTRPTEIVRYVTSWMCYENTNNGRPPCQKAE